MTHTLDFHPCFTCRPHGDVAKKCWNMGENPMCGSFLQNPLELLVYAIHIECRNPFCVCYLIYFSTRCGWGGSKVPSGSTLYKPQPICLKPCTLIYLTHARTAMKPDSPFLSSFIGKRDMPDMASDTGWLKCYITLFLWLITVRSWQKHQQWPRFLHCRAYSKKSNPTELIWLGYSECTKEVKNVGSCWCFCHDLTVINQKKRVI